MNTATKTLSSFVLAAAAALIGLPPLPVRAASAAASTSLSAPIYQPLPSLGFPIDPVVGVAARPRNGFWSVTEHGHVSGLNDAPTYGDASRVALTHPIVGMAATSTGNGYWLVASDGGVFGFGDAKYNGSTGGERLNQPIVGMAATRSGRGYWLVARDGGIFTFGDARYHGSTGAVRLNQPIMGMASTPTGNGYWLVAKDGGIFTFGDAHYFGSTAAYRLADIVSITRTRRGLGYYLLASDGHVYTFGEAANRGSAAGLLNRQAGITFVSDSAAGLAGTPDDSGYWIVGRSEWSSDHSNMPIGVRGTQVLGFPQPPVFHHVFEARPTTCSVNAYGTVTARFTVKYTNGASEARSYTYANGSPIVLFNLPVGGYALDWDYSTGKCVGAPMLIKHVLRAGKIAKYVRSEGCSSGPERWGVYYSVTYTDGTTAGGSVLFDTYAVKQDYGDLWVDLGNDMAVSQRFTIGSCG